MTGPVSVPIKYHLTSYDLERIKQHEEMLDGLKKIAELAGDMWKWNRLPESSLVEIIRIAERLIEIEMG